MLVIYKMFGFRHSDADDDGFKEAHIDRQVKPEEGGDAIPDLAEELADRHSFQYTKPDIKKAHEYFEHSLPRRVRDALQPTGFRINVPGEMRSHDGEPAELYNPWFASQGMLAEFGVGIDLYFYSLRLFNVLFLFAAFFGLLAIYENEEYNCDNVESRLVGSTYCATKGSLKADRQGLADILITVTITIGFYQISRMLEKRRDHVDDNSFTTADYSVCITNPDPEIQNPDDYAEHFRQFGDVVLVTIVKNNGDLLKNVARKKVLQAKLNIEKSVKAIAESQNKPYIDEDRMNPILKRFLPTLTGIQRELDEVETHMVSDMSRDYHPWRVYITFNKEKEAQKCLMQTDLTTMEISRAIKNGIGSLPVEKQAARMRDHVMNVNKSHEPDDVMYKNSNSTSTHRAISYVQSYLICSVFVVICYYIIAGISSASGAVTAVFISLINAVIPFLVKAVTDAIEIHLNDSDAQLSAMVKLTITRCFNSGVLIYLSVNYEDRFGQEALGQIQSILIADAISTPFMRFLNPYGLYKRHIASKNAVTQQQLDLLWAPQSWSLAERYTDTLKTVFVGMMYAVPLPSGLFITSFAMMSAYLVDKYSLFRMWERPSALDHSLAKMSQYFMFFTLWTHVFFSRTFFANWPFGDTSPVSCDFIVCSVKRGNGDSMSDDQAGIVVAYGVFNAFYLSVLAYLTYILFFRAFVYEHLYREGHEVTSKNDIAFRSLNSISGYVPLVKHASLTKPILFSDVSNLPEKYAPVYDGTDDFNDAPRDPTVFSVVNNSEFPDASEKDLKNLFSHIVFYEENTTNPINTHATAVANSKDELGKQLPPGWAMKTTGNGKPYYINHINRTTQWKRPQY